MWIWFFLGTVAFAELELPAKEVGPLLIVYPRPSHDTQEVGKAQVISIQNGHPLPAFRIESFGNMVFDLEITGQKGTRPAAWLEGPLENSGDNQLPGVGVPLVFEPGSKESNLLKVRMHLNRKGIYRVIPADFDALEKGKLPSEARKFSVLAGCVSACFSPSVPISAAQSSLPVEQREEFWKTFEAKLRQLIQVPETLNALIERLHKLRRAKDAGQFDTGLILPRVSHSEGLAPFLSMAHLDSPKVEKIEGEFLAELHSRPTDRKSLPSVLLEKPFELRYGHFVRQSLTNKELELSGGFAKILNALAAQNGTSLRATLTDGRQRSLTSLRELAGYLIETGHQIEIRQVRTHANFLSFVVNGQQLRIPVWTETGISLESGETLKIPMGHTEYLWTVSGPIVRARVAFYQGISGTGFFPSVENRPDWTGYISKQVLRSGQGRDEILMKVTEMAGKYIRRIALESETVAKGLPAQGYGVTGVCNDSAAVIQRLMGFDGFPLPYPLFRAKRLRSLPPALKADPRFDGELEALFDDYPYDGDLTDAELKTTETQRAILCRVLSMVPFPLDSPFFKSYGLDSYRTQLMEVSKRVQGQCE